MLHGRSPAGVLLASERPVRLGVRHGSAQPTRRLRRPPDYLPGRLANDFTDELRPVFHFLVTPHLQDALDYMRLHRYERSACAWIKHEDSLQLNDRPENSVLKIHYLRGWDKTDAATLARLRYLGRTCASVYSP